MASGLPGSWATFDTRNQPSSTATGANIAICQSMNAMPSTIEATFDSLRSPWSSVGGSSLERRHQRSRVAGQPLDELARRRRRLAVEGIPAGQEALADRVAIGPVAGGRRAASSRTIRSTSGHHGMLAVPGIRRPMTWSRATAVRTLARSPSGIAGSRRGRSQAISSSDRSGMRIAASSPSAAAPRYGLARRIQAPSGPVAARAVANHASRSASSRVARTIQSRAGRGPLEDEPAIAPIDEAERRARPAVVRERLLGQAVDVVQRQEVGELPARPGSARVEDRGAVTGPAAHRGAVASAPSRPPSM